MAEERRRTSSHQSHSTGVSESGTGVEPRSTHSKTKLRGFGGGEGGRGGEEGHILRTAAALKRDCCQTVCLDAAPVVTHLDTQ